MSEGPDEEDRREFLRVAIIGGAGLVALNAGFVNLSWCSRSGKSTSAIPLIAVSGLAALEQGKPVALEITLSIRDGWRVRNRRQVVYLRRKTEGDTAEAFEVLSPVCPHAGCGIELENEGFHCHCHDAKFSLNGEKVDGPAPRGMDPLPLTVMEYQGEPWLLVKWLDFVPGTEERVTRGRR